MCFSSFGNWISKHFLSAKLNVPCRGGYFVSSASSSGCSLTRRYRKLIILSSNQQRKCTLKFIELISIDKLEQRTSSHTRCMGRLHQSWRRYTTRVRLIDQKLMIWKIEKIVPFSKSVRRSLFVLWLQTIQPENKLGQFSLFSLSPLFFCCRWIQKVFFCFVLAAHIHRTTECERFCLLYFAGTRTLLETSAAI